MAVDATRKAVYIKDNEQIYVCCDGLTVCLPNFPEIKMSLCNQRCGGYRFQPYNHGPCKRKYTCFYDLCITANLLENVAPRYVKRCPICERLFLTGRGRKGSEKIENLACPSLDCMRQWSEKNFFSTVNKCMVCDKFCTTKIHITTSMFLNLPIRQTFAGSEFTLCPGPCTEKFKLESHEELIRRIDECLEQVRRGERSIEYDRKELLLKYKEKIQSLI